MDQKTNIRVFFSRGIPIVKPIIRPIWSVMSQRRPDNELTAAELERRNRRRARNREAATRQRDRRIFQVQNLESRVEQLRATKIQLSQENEQLRNQVEEAKRQFYDMTGYQYTNPNEQNSNSNSNQEIFYHV